MSLNQIYRDESLYGHHLVSLPHQIWTFTKGDFSLYEHPDPGTLVVDKNYIIAKRMHYRRGQNHIYRTEIVGEKLLCDLIEFVGRRVLGPCATAASYLTLTPIGFIAKIIHFSLDQVSIYTKTSPLSQKLSQIWADPSLFGHALTSSPSKCFQFSTTPFNWHLRSDGTDRRSYIFTSNSDGSVGKEQEAEYQLVPFELFEFFYRYVIGGTLTIVASIASPFGLIAKGVHLASRSFFRMESKPISES